jgi:aminoglycoside N3'-acetyltransferase
MTQQDAIQYAKHFGWTEADAKRAFASIDLKNADELALLTAMVNFAGPTLYKRQRLQGAQKGLVTKKENYIKQIELEFTEKINDYEEQLSTERSLFVATIARVYGVAKRFGFQDSWIEMLIEQYDDYQKRA